MGCWGPKEGQVIWKSRVGKESSYNYSHPCCIWCSWVASGIFEAWNLDAWCWQSEFLEYTKSMIFFQRCSAANIGIIHCDVWLRRAGDSCCSLLVPQQALFRKVWNLLLWFAGHVDGCRSCDYCLWLCRIDTWWEMASVQRRTVTRSRYSPPQGFMEGYPPTTNHENQMDQLGWYGCMLIALFSQLSDVFFLVIQPWVSPHSAKMFGELEVEIRLACLISANSCLLLVGGVQPAVDRPF